MTRLRRLLCIAYGIPALVGLSLAAWAAVVVIALAL